MYKLLVVALIALSVVAQDEPEPSAECMYCRRMDRNSGFLVSYSYCQNTEECLLDAWNYINRDCENGW